MTLIASLSGTATLLGIDPALLLLAAVGPAALESAIENAPSILTWQTP